MFLCAFLLRVIHACFLELFYRSWFRDVRKSSTKISTFFSKSFLLVIPRPSRYYSPVLHILNATSLRISAELSFLPKLSIDSPELRGSKKYRMPIRQTRSYIFLHLMTILLSRRVNVDPKFLLVIGTGGHYFVVSINI